MMRFRPLAILFFTIALAACGNSSSDSSDGGFNGSLRVEPVSGVIDGNFWIYQSGRARRDPFQPGMLNIELWSQDSADPCSAMGLADQKVIFSIPEQTGDYGLGNTRNFTLYSYSGGQNKNVVVTKGLIRISDITTASVSGALAGAFNDANQVNGTFTVPYCNN